MNSDKGKSREKKKRNDENREIELALAISIILANLSCEEDFIKTLLGVDVWPKKAAHDGRANNKIKDADCDLKFKHNKKMD